MKRHQEETKDRREEHKQSDHKKKRGKVGKTQETQWPNFVFPYKEWARNAAIQQRKPMVEFMLTECRCSSTGGADVALYGVDRRGSPVHAIVTGYQPYFYIEAQKQTRPEHQEQLLSLLHSLLSTCTHSGTDTKKKTKKPVSPQEEEEEEEEWTCTTCTLLNKGSDEACQVCHNPRIIVISSGDDEQEDNNKAQEEKDKKGPLVQVEMVKKKSLMYYRPDEAKDGKDFFKITLQLPSTVAKSARFLQSSRAGAFQRELVFEANVPFELRFMVDHGLVGGGWIRISMSMSSPSVTIHVHASDVSPIAEGLEYIQDKTTVPLRVLSLDVQAARNDDAGARTTRSIATVFCDNILDENATLTRVIYVLAATATTLVPKTKSKTKTKSKSKAKYAGKHVKTHVVVFYDEATMLLAWNVLFRCVDPDVFVGYNVANQDFAFLLSRATTLRIRDAFATLGRFQSTHACTVKKVQTYSAGWVRSQRRMTQTSNQESAYIDIPGVLFLDMMKVIQTNHSLRTYSLEEACHEFLGHTKELVPVDELDRMWEEWIHGSSSQPRCVSYAIRQSVTALLLMKRLMTLTQTVEMARVTGLNMNQIWTRGQMIRTWSLLLRQCRTVDGGIYVIPTVRDNATQPTMNEGPLILDPLELGTTGFHDAPVVVLDFASLYPSIMIAYNLCYSTLLVPEDEKHFREERDSTRTPVQRLFVKPHIRSGVVPQILKQLLDARQRVKRAMSDLSEHEQLYHVYNERQKALKISANAAYGFTGSQASKLLCAALAESTITFGAALLAESANWVSKQATASRSSVTFLAGTQPQVIYGATDSLFVKFSSSVSTSKATQLGRLLSAHLSKGFAEPISIKFEKTYRPFLLQQINHYAGVIQSGTPETRLDVKGMECVRRDIVPLVSSLVRRCLTHILIDKRLPAAIQLVKDVVGQVLHHELPLSEFIVTKALWRGTSSSQYAVKQAHTELVQRIRARDPNIDIVLGERVRYVFVQTGNHKTKQHEKSEDPLYVTRQKLVVDASLYVQNYIKKPVVRLLCLPGLMDSKENVERKLFASSLPHMRSRKEATLSPVKGIGKFFKRSTSTLRCIECKNFLPQTMRKDPYLTEEEKQRPPQLCDRCSPNRKYIQSRAQRVHTQGQKRLNAMVAKCASCMGDADGNFDFVCCNQDCDTLFVRYKLEQEQKTRLEKVGQLE